MNNKKIIFLVVLWILVVFILIIVLLLPWANKTSETNSVSWVFKVWIYWDSEDDFKAYFEDFKKEYNYKLTPEITSFNDWEEYNLVLASAFARWEGPDIFVLNNNEKSVFLENVVWIDPNSVDPDSFRSNYKWIFSDDLIISLWEWKEKQEFLLWVPIWYETLGFFYDRKRVQAKDLENWASLNAKILELKEKRSDIVPLAIWDWSTVKDSVDILTQFFMLSDISGIQALSSSIIKSGLWDYFSFLISDWNNNYLSKSSKLKLSWKDNIDLFSRWEVSMIIWYPRMLLDIVESWFSKSFLLASVFPEYIPGQGKALVNYNYFVVNKNSSNQEVAFDLLSYMTSKKGISNYLDKFSYYLPAYIPLEWEYLDKNILEDYNVKTENFYNDDLVLSSFDKWVKSIYDRDVVNILDDSVNYIDLFTKFISRLSCVSDKVINLGDLSKQCN